VLCHGSSITYHACSLFSLCRRLLITTNLVCHHFESAWCWPGTGETLPPCNVSENMLLFPAHTGVCARLESAWLPAGVAGVRPSATATVLHRQSGQSSHLWLSNVFGHRFSAYPFLGDPPTPPRESVLFARSARLPATEACCDRLVDERSHNLLRLAPVLDNNMAAIAFLSSLSSSQISR
jgi:hypothetical protein